MSPIQALVFPCSGILMASRMETTLPPALTPGGSITSHRYEGECKFPIFLILTRDFYLDSFHPWGRKGEIVAAFETNESRNSSML
jgi:hypothetical protein